MREVESLVQRNVQQALFSVGYRLNRKVDARGEIRHAKDDRNEKTRRGKGGRGAGGQSEKSIPPPNPRKQVCFDCGDEDHYAGDFRCKFPSKYTLTKRRPSPTERPPFQGQRQQKNVFAQTPAPEKETNNPYVGSWSLV